MVMPTTKLLTPDLFIINNGTKELSYPIAQNRNKVRQWRKTKVRIQPGEGELVKHWDSFHAGMGWSRDESRDAQYALPVYESGTGVACRRGYLYPAFKVNTISLSGTPTSVDRITEIGLYIYGFGTTAANLLTVHKIRASDDTVMNEKTFSSPVNGPAGQPTEFGGYLYVPIRSTAGASPFLELTTIRADTSDDTWNGGPTDRRAWHLATAGKLLWRVGDSATIPKRYVINSCAAVSSGGSGGPLTAGNWSDPADYVIGKPGRVINSLAEMGRWLHVGKEEGLYASDTEGNQTNALDFVRNLITSTNCSDMIRWLGTLVVCHKTGIWQWTGVSARPFGIEILQNNNSSIKGGRYTALATAGEWLYTAYLVGTTTYLLAVRPGREDEPSYVWHHLYTFTSTTISTMHISGLTTNPRLYLGITASTCSVAYIILAQDGSPDPTDANVTFQAQTNSFDLPAVDWGFPATPKHGHMVEIVTSQAKGTGGTVKVYYGWDGATPSTQLGSTITTATKTQCFWAGGNTQGTHWGYRPQIRIENTGHASNVLRVEKVSLYCAARPRKEPTITVVVRCGDMLDRLRDAKTAFDDLEALENAGVYLVRDPDDPASGTFYATVENVDEHSGEQLADYTGERLVTVTLRVVEYA